MIDIFIHDQKTVVDVFCSKHIGIKNLSVIENTFPFLIIIAFFLCIYLDCPSARSRIS